MKSPHLFLVLSYCTVSLFLVALFVPFCGSGGGEGWRKVKGGGEAVIFASSQ